MVPFVRFTSKNIILTLNILYCNLPHRGCTPRCGFSITILWIYQLYFVILQSKYTHKTTKMLIQNPNTFEGTCYAFKGKDIIQHTDNTSLTLSDLKTLQSLSNKNDIWEEREQKFCTLLVTDDKLPSEYSTTPLRLHTTNIANEKEIIQIQRAKALANWTTETRHCPRCGTKLIPHNTLSALQCNDCGKIIFPRIEPCVIVLVKKGRQILLARHSQRNNDIHACIAGFMEAGETAEQAVKRELMEETGIKVKNIQYFGTQSWPYPSQLMIAFTAEWESGEPKPQDGELSDIGWFSTDNLPNTPRPGSIAYRMIMSSLSC